MKIFWVLTEASIQMSINRRLFLSPTVHNSLQSFADFKVDMHNIYIRAWNNLAQQLTRLPFIHWQRDLYSVWDMASWVACPRFGRGWKGGSTKKEGWGQVARHTVGREKAQWKSGSRDKGSSWSGIGSCEEKEGRRSSNSTESRGHNNDRKGGLGSVFRIGGRGDRPCRRGNGPKNHFDPTQMAAHPREIGSTEKGEGLEAGHRPDHINLRRPLWYWKTGSWCHQGSAPRSYDRATDCVVGPKATTTGTTSVAPVGRYLVHLCHSRYISNRIDAKHKDGQYHSVNGRRTSSRKWDW